MLGSLLLCLTLAGPPEHPAPIDPPAARAELRFGIEMAGLHLWREARFRFERAVALDYRNARAWNALAIAYEVFGDLEHARLAYDQAVALNPSDPTLRGNREAFYHDHPDLRPADGMQP